MDIQDIVRQSLLFLHLMAFAIAIAEVLRADLRLLRAIRVDRGQLASTIRITKWSLAVLWATGLALIYINPGFDPQILMSNPKLLTKIIVVATLTANGILLHAVVFPHLLNNKTDDVSAAFVATTLGAVSTTSWIYAGFVGVSRIVAPNMPFSIYISLYELALAIGIGTALFLVQPQVRRLLANSRETTRPGNPTSAIGGDLRALHQLESAAQTLGAVQNQLLAARAGLLNETDSPTGCGEIGDPAACAASGTVNEPGGDAPLAQAATG
jgi:hypothetical protein